MVWLPAADGVKVTEQELVNVPATPSPTRVQVVPGRLNAPAPDEPKVTVPAGSDFPPAAVSVTVAVQTLPWLMTTLAGTQSTLVEVDRSVTAIVSVPLLEAWIGRASCRERVLDHV